jgi:hypothetical protein
MKWGGRNRGYLVKLVIVHVEMNAKNDPEVER